MKTALAKAAILTLSSLLAACANLAPPNSQVSQVKLEQSANTANKTANKPANTAPAASPSAAAAAADTATLAANASKNTEDDEDGPSFDPNLPSVPLTADVMFQILGSEIASQRGQWQRGFVTLQALAQQTRDPRLARRAMEMAYAGKNFEEALVAARLWRQLAPNSDEAAQALMLFAVMQDKIAEVMPALVQRLKDTPPAKRGEVIITTYQRYLSQARDKALMFAQMEILYAPYIELVETHLVLAQAALHKGDQARALSETKAALAIKPDSEIALTLLMYTSDNFDATQKVVDEFVAKHPKGVDFRLTWARMLADRKQYEKSRAQFEILVQEKTHALTSLKALSEISVRMKDYAGAEKYLLQYLAALSAKKDDGNEAGRAMIFLSQLAEERGDPRATMEWLEKVPASDVNNYFNANARRAALLAKGGKLEEARTLLHSLSPSNEQEKVQLIQQESQMLRDAKQILQSYSLLSSALKTYPNNTDLLYDHGMAAEKLNRLAEMEASFRKVIKLAPDNHQAYNALGYSFAERNIRLPEALTLIEKATQMAPNDPFIMDSLGWVQFKLGKLKEAEATLRRAYQLRPDVEIATHLGEVLWQSGHKEAAEKIWREARSKEPDSETLKSTLARLRVKL